MKEADDMINRLICISVNHKKAPVDVIESVFYKDAVKGMKELREKSFSDEIVLIQTCNRVEAYIYSREPRVSGEIIKSLFKGRIKGMTLIDLSNPRNVDERISGVLGVELKTIDDLRSISERNREERLKEVEKAEKIILEEISSFRREMKKFAARKVLKKVFARAEEIRRRELEKAIKIINFNESNAKVLDAMTKSIINKILTPVIVKAEKAALNDESEIVEIISEIFSGVRR